LKPENASKLVSLASKMEINLGWELELPGLENRGNSWIVA